MYLGRRSDSFPLAFRALKFLSQSWTKLRCFSTNVSKSTWPSTTHSYNTNRHGVRVRLAIGYIFCLNVSKSKLTEKHETQPDTHDEKKKKEETQGR